jgi:exopolysaccharide biosynthesis operon protein EpsL
MTLRFLGKGFFVPVLMGSTLTYMGLHTTTAYADKDDTFNIVAETHYEHDSNLFRLPDHVQPPNGDRSDNVWDTSLGFSIDKKYSLQRFKFDYAHESVKYDNADFLDFEANNYFGAWLWAVTPNLTGTLSSKRTTDLVPFLDYQNTNSQNKRVIKEHVFNFDYSPHNVWHLLGGVSKLDVQNSQSDFFQENSFKMNSVEAGVKYTFPSNSYFMYKHKVRNGDQTESVFNSVSTGFKEKEDELSMFWLISGKSKASANFGHVSRDDDQYGFRDFSGYFGGVNYSWDITGKVNLTVDLSRRVAAYQDLTSSYNTIDAFSVKPTWAVLPKVKISATALVNKRRFLGNGPNPGFGTREDEGRYFAIGADWTPRSTIKLGIALQHDVRNSNDPIIDRDYSANIASINGQINF